PWWNSLCPAPVPALRYQRPPARSIPDCVSTRLSYSLPRGDLVVASMRSEGGGYPRKSQCRYWTLGKDVLRLSHASALQRGARRAPALRVVRQSECRLSSGSTCDGASPSAS